MSYTKGYKPVPMDAELTRLLESAALVHMLEFKTPLDNEKGQEYLLNLASSYSKPDGYLGSFSETWSRSFFCTETKTYPAMPTSAIKAGYPFTLLNMMSDVGIVKDPAMADFVYVAHSDVCSRCLKDDKTIYLDNKFEFSEQLDVNLGAFGRINKDETRLELRYPRIEKDAAALKEYFYSDFFRAYSAGHEPGSNEFIKQISRLLESQYHSTLTEIGATNSAEGDRAILIYKTPFEDFDKMNKGNLIGLDLAYLLKRSIKQRAEIDLPIIIYEVQKGYRPPKITQIEVDRKMIAEKLSENTQMRNLYIDILGEHEVQNIISGKSNKVHSY